MTRNRATRLNAWTLVGVRDRLDHVTPFFDEATFRAGFGIPRQLRLGSVAYRQAITTGDR